MANKNISFDCSTTDLFCNEETQDLCFNGDDDFNIESLNDQDCQINGGDEMGFVNDGLGLNPFIDLPCLSEESIDWMLEREKKHFPRDDYLDRLRSGDLNVGLRRDAISWMFKVRAFYNFGELCLYTAMNYFDRFLSVYEIPEGKTWAIQLAGVACLSLAAKMEEVNVPSAVNLQVAEPIYLFQGKNIQRMELLVLSYLKWEIKPYTPCNFIDYYLRKMNGGEFSLGPMITKSLQIISRTIKGIDFLEFKPSEIAAAVAIFVSGDTQVMDIDKTLSSCKGVEKGKVMKCLELIQDLTPISPSASPFVPHSPSGVLDAACLSYKSDERKVESFPSSSQSTHGIKRRKLDMKS